MPDVGRSSRRGSRRRSSTGIGICDCGFSRGWGNNSYQRGPIYSERLTYRTYREEVVTASGEAEVQLTDAIAAVRKRMLAGDRLATAVSMVSSRWNR